LIAIDLSIRRVMHDDRWSTGRATAYPNLKPSWSTAKKAVVPSIRLLA